MAVTGNSISSSYIGDGLDHRGADDRSAAGIVLEGATDVGVSGNVFSGVRSKALELRGSSSRQILFGNNLLTDTTSDHVQLDDSVVGENLVH
jgi:hypothetical protein